MSVWLELRLPLFATPMPSAYFVPLSVHESCASPRTARTRLVKTKTFLAATNQKIGNQPLIALCYACGGRAAEWNQTQDCAWSSFQSLSGHTSARAS